MRPLFIALIACCFTCTAIARSEGPTVLLITDTNDYVHDVVKPTDGDSVVKKTVQSVVEGKLGGRLVHCSDAATLSADQLDPAKTKAIVMYTTGNLPLDVEALNRYVEGGGALMGIHCATDTFHKDAGFYGLIGGTFKEHPWTADTEVTLKALEPDHPVVAPIGASRTLKEEIYIFSNFDPAKVRVLMVLDMVKTEMKRPQVVPIVWVKQVGKGRVLYTSLGHNEAVWKSDWYQQHLANSLKWLMGEVEGAAEPNPDVTKKEDELAKVSATLDAAATEGIREEGARLEGPSEPNADVTAEAKEDALARQAAGQAGTQARVSVGAGVRLMLNGAALRGVEFTPAQDADETGFTVLFDGTEESAKKNWRGFKKQELPSGWAVDDGAITLKDRSQGDIVTRETYADFDLRLEWNVAPAGNSGIMYRVSETGDGTDATYLTGPEYQVLDDKDAADNKTTLTRAGALYGLYPAPDPSPVKPAGEWNEARIILKGNHVEHWLNGQKLFEAEMGSEDWNQRLARSKFAKWARFAKETEGHIALQDHGDEVSYRNIRIKPLDGEKGAKQPAAVPEGDGMK